MGLNPQRDRVSILEATKAWISDTLLLDLDPLLTFWLSDTDKVDRCDWNSDCAERLLQAISICKRQI